MLHYVENENLHKEYLANLQHENSFEVAFALNGLDEILQSGLDHFLVPKIYFGVDGRQELRKENPFAVKVEEHLNINYKKLPLKFDELQNLHNHESRFVRQKSKELYAKFANHKIHGKK